MGRTAKTPPGTTLTRRQEWTARRARLRVVTIVLICGLLSGTTAFADVDCSLLTPSQRVGLPCAKAQPAQTVYQTTEPTPASSPNEIFEVGKCYLGTYSVYPVGAKRREGPRRDEMLVVLFSAPSRVRVGVFLVSAEWLADGVRVGVVSFYDDQPPLPLYPIPCPVPRDRP